MDDSSRRSVNDQTRSVYRKQHERVVNDAAAMSRFLNMIQESYFSLESDYFRGKRVLDAGCGDTAKMLIRLSQFGATDLTGLDLNVDFTIARESLRRHGVPDSCVKLVSGSVDALPFADGEFDFVCCHGVLLHMADMEQAARAFRELARVTRPAGWLYVVCGLFGGLWEALYPAVRQYYRENELFRDYVDRLSPENFHDVLRFVSEKVQLMQGEEPHLEDLESLFDTDLCVTIQNVIQAPVRLPLSPEWILGAYAAGDFEAPRRLKRYVIRNNIRKFFAPLHYFGDHPLSRLLYGTGNLEYIARKNGDARGG